MIGSVYFTPAQSQLFAFISTLSRVEPGLIQADPFALSHLDETALQGVNPETTMSLDLSHLAAAAYLNKLGKLEDELIKTLAIEPDDLLRHENHEKPAEDFFEPKRLAWQQLTHLAPLAIDDLLTIRRARQQADRKVNKWARVYTGQLATLSIDNVTDDLNKALSALSVAWLYRIDLARFSYGFVAADPFKALNAFFDEGVRSERMAFVLQAIEASSGLFASGNDQ